MIEFKRGFVVLYHYYMRMLKWSLLYSFSTLALLGTNNELVGECDEHSNIITFHSIFECELNKNPQFSYMLVLMPIIDVFLEFA